MKKLFRLLFLFAIPAFGQQPSVNINIKSVLTLNTPSPLTPCTVGVACSQTLLASGGQAPLAFVISSQTTMATITSAGVLSLTAATAGKFSITIMVYDSGAIQQWVNRTYAITVNPANPTPAKTYGITWTPPADPRVVGFNVFLVAPAGPTQLNPAPITAQPYVVQCAGSCSYVMTSVGSSGDQSGYSDPASTP